MSRGVARWTFRLADGQLVTGPVQGCGGVIDARGGRRRLIHAADRARAGESIASMYEPAPGHVRVYPGYYAAGDGESVDVDIRSAELQP